MSNANQSHALNPIHHYDISKLFCYGCAHAASSASFPGKPSGERPCCFCIRNPERDAWVKLNKISTERSEELKDNKGNPRDFNPFAANLYNGAPALYNPMDNYVTLDHLDQERWLDDHPDYRKPIRFINGIPTIIENEDE